QLARKSRRTPRQPSASTRTQGKSKTKTLRFPRRSPLLSVSPKRVALPLTAALASVQGPPLSDSPEEPILDIRDIQGNILVGFNKDHQAFLFFQITDVQGAKRWLQAITPQIATVDETLAFRRLFRAMRARRGEEADGLIATWINIAFSRSGIEKLTS